jgi:concanavalin A-like lectin/glucanase superfamily protein
MRKILTADRVIVWSLAFALAFFPPIASVRAATGWLPLAAKKSGGGGGWCSLIPQSGLVNCWPFDTANTTTSVATDVTGGKNATLTNVTLNGSGPSTNLNNAGVFNGSSSNGTTTLANVPTAAFSIVTWVKPTVVATGGRYMANCHTDADNNGIQLENSSTWVSFFGNGTTFAADSTNTSSTAWAMVTWTYDGTTITSYLGSASQNTNTLTGPSTGCATNIAFGFNPAYSGDFFGGLIAGVAIYNRALTSGEVTTINGL